MENASKALIIAGAILVSILIISLGIVIYQKAAATAGKADLSGPEASAQNSKFEAYFGNNKTSAEVKQLLSTIRTNNITSGTNEEAKTIAVRYIEASVTNVDFTTAVNTIATKLKAGKTYTVDPSNDSASKDESDIGSKTDAEIANDPAGYYKSGFLRCIVITLN